MRKINFSKNFHYIVYGLLSTQHARCHKAYYSPRGRAVSTSHVTFVSSFTLEPTSPWPRNITLRETPALRVIYTLLTPYLQRNMPAATKNFRPAVNRQPMFPREMTRRADSACPPTNSLSEFPRLLQLTRFKTSENIGFL